MKIDRDFSEVFFLYWQTDFGILTKKKIFTLAMLFVGAFINVYLLHVTGFVFSPLAKDFKTHYISKHCDSADWLCNNNMSEHFYVSYRFLHYHLKIVIVSKEYSVHRSQMKILRNVVRSISNITFQNHVRTVLLNSMTVTKTYHSDPFRTPSLWVISPAHFADRHYELSVVIEMMEILL